MELLTIPQIEEIANCLALYSTTEGVTSADVDALCRTALALWAAVEKAPCIPYCASNRHTETQDDDGYVTRTHLKLLCNCWKADILKAWRRGQR